MGPPTICFMGPPSLKLPHGDPEIEVYKYLGPLAGLVALECELDCFASDDRLFLTGWAADAREVTEV